MNEKTRAEYESIKTRWQEMSGVVSDNMLTPDDGRRPYLCLTLHETCAATPEAVSEVLARMGDIAVRDRAYLTMNVHYATVKVQLLVSTEEVDAPAPYAVQTPTPPEVDAHGFVAVPTDPDLCQCGESRAHVTHIHDVQGGM